MAQTKPIPVRLDDRLIARLGKSADSMGSNKSALIKFLVKTFLDHFEARGGLASLPPNWQEIMKQQDGRTFGQQMAGMKQSLRVAEEPEVSGKMLLPEEPAKPVKYSAKNKKGPKS